MSLTMAEQLTGWKASKPAKPAPAKWMQAGWKMLQSYPAIRGRLPLTIGVTDELVRRHPEIDARVIKILIFKHCQKRRYLEAVVSGTRRFDIDGRLADEILPAHKLWSVQRLAELKVEREA